jgi:hypothetical protein
MNDTPVSLGGKFNSTNISKIVNLTQGNTIGWRFYVNDTGGQWNSTPIQNFTVANTAPTIVNLSLPTNDSTIIDRMPFFNWTASYDADNDSINYSITINEIYCDTGAYPNECVVTPIQVNSLNSTNYTLTQELGIDARYNWTVRAYDGQDYSEWSTYFNFTVEGILSLSLDCVGCNNGVEFGDVYNALSYNTTNTSGEDTAKPLIMENAGNVFVDITLNATSQLWSSQYLNTLFFQFKAGNASEANSFNWSNSSTAWTNVNSTPIFAISYLNYSNASDMAEIDLNIRVPDDEPAGIKTTNLVIEATYYD